jgi:hypothetical protein
MDVNVSNPRNGLATALIANIGRYSEPQASNTRF